MGCTASSSPDAVGPASTQPQNGHNRPVANVPPQQNDVANQDGNMTHVKRSKSSSKSRSSSSSSCSKESVTDIEQTADEEEMDIEVKDVEMSKDLLLRYVELEKETRDYESKNLLQTLKMKVCQLAELNDTVAQLAEHHKRCAQQTAKEKADVDNIQQSVKSFFNDQESYDSQLSKEQEEYLEALNVQEIAKKDLDGVTRQRDSTQQEVDHLKAEADKLTSIYREQDELLASIFNGKYGSDAEYQLESTLDMLLDRQQRINVARVKWSHARQLVLHACNQLAFAVRRWMGLSQVPLNNMPMRFMMVTEARNNLIAANRNLTSAHMYVSSIQFPYCTAAEMETLKKATDNIYNDMQTTERQQLALNCYATTHKRAAALIQWIDRVINETISKDLTEATNAVNAQERELQTERVRLIKIKIKTEIGEDVEFDIDAENFEGSADDYCKEIADVMEADTVSDSDATTEGAEQPKECKDENYKSPTPLPLNELAPPPNQQDLFGDIDDLKKQHEQEMEDFKKAQELNKARMDQGLDEKLRARRSRRKRQAAQEKQN